MKDVSNFPEVQDSESTSNQADIPIYGHSESDETSSLSRTKKRSKRVFDQDNNQNDQSGVQNSENQSHKDVHSDDKSDHDNTSDNSGSISEAGEVENEAYKIPPLTLLNQPAKQQSTSKAEVQKKGQLLETTLKNFGVDARVTQIKIGPAVTQYEIHHSRCKGK